MEHPGSYGGGKPAAPGRLAGRESGTGAALRKLGGTGVFRALPTELALGRAIAIDARHLQWQHAHHPAGVFTGDGRGALLLFLAGTRRMGKSRARNYRSVSSNLGLVALLHLNLAYDSRGKLPASANSQSTRRPAFFPRLMPWPPR